MPFWAFFAQNAKPVVIGKIVIFGVAAFFQSQSTHHPF
jgi:hypothetical protein